jgi:hypothetical protein
LYCIISILGRVTRINVNKIVHRSWIGIMLSRSAYFVPIMFNVYERGEVTHGPRSTFYIIFTSFLYIVLLTTTTIGDTSHLFYFVGIV